MHSFVPVEYDLLNVHDLSLVETGTVSSVQPLEISLSTLSSDPTFVEFDIADLFVTADVQAQAIGVNPSDHTYAAANITEEHQYVSNTVQKKSAKHEMKHKVVGQNKKMFAVHAHIQRSVKHARKCIVTKACRWGGPRANYKTVGQVASQAELLLGHSVTVKRKRSVHYVRAKRKQSKKRNFFLQFNGLQLTRQVSQVLHSLHPDLHMSCKGMNIVHDFLGDVFEQVAETASELMQKVGRHTLQARDIAGAIALMLSGELKLFLMTKGLQVLTLTADSYGLDTCVVPSNKFKHTTKCAKL